MPELPEVETIRRDLNRQIVGKKINQVKVVKKRLVRNQVNFFIKKLNGNYFKNIDRVGKLLILNLKSGEHLLAHLKMTGQLIYQDKRHKIAGGHSFQSDRMDYPNKYTYISIGFSEGASLYFNDMRTFGYMQIVSSQDLEKIKASYGLEPICPKATPKVWREIFKNRKTNLKAILMNQKVIAGIGNIYADEICFASKILPSRSVASLSDNEIDLLLKNSRKILNKAIKERGTTFNNYRDSRGNKGNFVKFLKVYGREGKICLRCRSFRIQKIKHAGRGTHFCANCQK